MIECIYCGIPANALDHIIPVSYTDVSRKAAKYNKNNTVPCCNECNTTLSDKWLPTISERASFILEKYNIKYKKLLNSPDWAEWEIEELRGNMKKIVLENKTKKLLLQERLEHLLKTHSQQDLIPIDVWNTYPEDMFFKFKCG